MLIWVKFVFFLFLWAQFPPLATSTNKAFLETWCSLDIFSCLYSTDGCKNPRISSLKHSRPSHLIPSAMLRSKTSLFFKITFFLLRLLGALPKELLRNRPVASYQGVKLKLQKLSRVNRYLPLKERNDEPNQHVLANYFSLTYDLWT